MTIYKGWNASLLLRIPYSSGTWLTIGCAESISFEIARNLEAYYCLGAATPADIVEGNLEITGSLSRAWVNTYYLDLVGQSTLTSFDICVNIGSTGPQVYIYGCKFEKGTVDIPQDGFLKEDYDFRATSIYYASTHS